MLQSHQVCSNIVIIGKDKEFRVANSSIRNKILPMIEAGKEFIGINCVPLSHEDETPALLITKEPNLFPEGGIYIQGNPIPHVVNPITIKTWLVDFYVYEIYYL